MKNFRFFNKFGVFALLAGLVLPLSVTAATYHPTGIVTEGRNAPAPAGAVIDLALADLKAGPNKTKFRAGDNFSLFGQVNKGGKDVFVIKANQGETFDLTISGVESNHRQSKMRMALKGFGLDLTDAIVGPDGSYSWQGLSRTKVVMRGVRRDSGYEVSVSTVPLPASSLLLVAAIGGLAAMRRRKQTII